MPDLIIKKLAKRGVQLEDLAQLVLQLQKPYIPCLDMETCMQGVIAILKKREFQYAILTGIALDELAEKRLLEEPLQSIIANDEPLYGVDEALAAACGNLYGSIGITNFGYLDKVKPGIIKKLNSSEDKVNTFLDDLVSAIVASAAGRIAHNYKKEKGVS